PIIGTHIHPSAGRRGIGRRLFAISLSAAKSAGLRHIDASIAADNGPALAYYSAMGFTPYRQGDDVIPHRFDLQSAPTGRWRRMMRPVENRIVTTKRLGPMGTGR